MLCEQCKKNNATTYIKQNLNGTIREGYYCTECARQFGGSEGSFGGFGFDWLPQLFAQISSPPAVSKCSHCGTSIASVSEFGRVGCAWCYTEFRDTIRRLLPRLSGNKTHVGKTPNGVNTPPSGKEDETVEDLRRQLDVAIAQERFEDASVLRDRIRDLEEPQKNL